MNLDLRQLHGAILDLAGVLNRPQPGLVLMREAGISLAGALFPLLIRIERRGPIGVVELAELAGRDYTTVSRQVAKLESLGLASRRANTVDRRVREVVVTPVGLAMTGAVDLAREKLMAAIIASWNADEIHEFVRLSRKLAAAIAGAQFSGQPRTQEPCDSSGRAAPLPGSEPRAIDRRLRSTPA
jgi:DNA-binding MarR family transcriptional regulator